MNINPSQNLDSGILSDFVHCGFFVVHAAQHSARQRFRFSFENRASDEIQRVEAFTNLMEWYYARYFPTFVSSACAAWGVNAWAMLWDRIALDVLSSFKKIPANRPNIEELVMHEHLMTEAPTSQETLRALTKSVFVSERLERQAIAFARCDTKELLCNDPNLAAALNAYLDEFALPCGSEKQECFRDVLVSLYADVSLDGYGNTPSHWFPRQRELTKQFIAELASFLQKRTLPSDFPQQEISGWQPSVLFTSKQAYW